MFSQSDMQSLPSNLSRWEHNIHHTLAQNDFDFVSGDRMIEFMLGEPGVNPFTIDEFARSWDDLLPDRFMADGGTYRTRRHATLAGVRAGGPTSLRPHQPHFQPLAYNTLNGGIKRHYSAILPTIVEGPVMKAILGFATSVFGALAPYYTWHIEIHQFRVSATRESGKPTPEGVHKDGVNYVLMTLLDRRNITGGLTSIYQDGKKTTELLLNRAFDTALTHDEQVAHSVSPIEAEQQGKIGYRDALVITFKRKSAANDTGTPTNT